MIGLGRLLDSNYNNDILFVILNQQKHFEVTNQMLGIKELVIQTYCFLL